ncbi:CBS domain-containing protein [Frankia tisae]|uniref:CBS domain-containing protein n=1 Tax=Frankia tisae TaxID=2950104 RepID=UPI0021C062F3|nr:CBS domain-containing protein [Frankia tisae]
MTYIGSVVSRPPVTVARATTIGEAAQEMGRAGVGALLVVDDDQQVGERLVGIVTDRDIVLRGVARGIGPDGRIDALMTTEVITVPAGMGVERAYEIFRDHAIRRLPVLDGRRIIGMVSVDDLLIRSEREIADLVHPLCDETFAPHREAAPPVVTGRAPATAAMAGTAGGLAAMGAATAVRMAGFAAPARRRTALHAHPGDTLVVHSHIPRAPDRLGEIFEVRTEAGDPPFAVRWSDTGHVSFVYPGPDAEVRCAGERSAADSTH